MKNSCPFLLFKKYPKTLDPYYKIDLDIWDCFAGHKTHLSILQPNKFVTYKKVRTNQTMRINKIYHQSPMQTEKSQPEGKRIMPETRFTEFTVLSVDPRVKISQSASETDD